MTVEVPTPTGSPSRVVKLAPAKGWRAIDWRELWEQRELLGILIQRDLRVRYKQTALGAGWAILQPALTVAVFWAVFGAFAGIPSDGAPYPVFACAGILPWTLFSASVSAGGMSLVNQQHLLTKVYFPRLYIPATGIGTALTDFTIAFVLLIVALLAMGYPVGWSLLAVVPLLLITTCAAFGTSLFLAALTVTYRDVRFVIPFLVQLWMYLSPVVYSSSAVPAAYRTIFAINPMFGVIGGFRSAMLQSPWDWQSLAIGGTTSALMLAFGLYYFRSVEERFADIA